MSVTLPKPAPPLTRRGGRTRETVLFLVAVALIALHVLDDNFVQPQPGTSPGDHLVSGLVPLALLGLAAWAYPRLRGGRRGALALAFGVLRHRRRHRGLPLREARSVLQATTSRACSAFPPDCFCSASAPSRCGGRAGPTAASGGESRRRALLAVVAFFVAPLGVVAGYGYVTTHVARAVVPAERARRRVRGREVHDRRRARARRLVHPVASNGAAVISFPGRSGPQQKARMLARHGYGVLLFDRRGEGRSEGEPNSLGLGRRRATSRPRSTYLQRRPDVDPDRIGGIGLSVGGEMMIETAAETDELKAVVSEGAGRADVLGGHGHTTTAR